MKAIADRAQKHRKGTGGGPPVPDVDWSQHPAEYKRVAMRLGIQLTGRTALVGDSDLTSDTGNDIEGGESDDDAETYRHQDDESLMGGDTETTETLKAYIVGDDGELSELPLTDSMQIEDENSFTAMLDAIDEGALDVFDANSSSTVSTVDKQQPSTSAAFVDTGRKKPSSAKTVEKAEASASKN